MASVSALESAASACRCAGTPLWRLLLLAYSSCLVPVVCLSMVHSFQREACFVEETMFSAVKAVPLVTTGVTSGALFVLYLSTLMPM